MLYKAQIELTNGATLVKNSYLRLCCVFNMGIPSGSNLLPTQQTQTEDVGLIAWFARSQGEGNNNPFQYSSCKSQGQRSQQPIGSQESDRTEHTQQHVPPVRISQPLVHWCLSSVLIYLTYQILQMCLPSGPFWHLAMFYTLHKILSHLLAFFTLFQQVPILIFPLMLDLVKSSIQVRSTILFHFPRRLCWLKHQGCSYITLKKKLKMRKCFRIYEN